MKLANALAPSLALASLCIASLAWSAEPVSYSGGSASISGIGNQMPGGTYDKLSLTGLSGTIGNSGLIDLDSVSFDVGVNTKSTSPYTVTGSISENVTIAGVTDTIFIPYSETVDAVHKSCGFDCTTYGDSITLETTSATFGSNVALNYLEPLKLTTYDGVVSGTLIAYVTNKTPVPTAAPEIDPTSAATGISLLLGGLAVFMGRRRSNPLAAG